MIHLVDLSISFSGTVILKPLNWFVGPRDRIGLVGNNGSGKTTLMKIIAGINQADQGNVVFAKGVTFGYLPQDGVIHEGRTVYQEAESVFGDLKALQQEENSLLAAMETVDPDSSEYYRSAQRLGELHDRMRLFDGYRLEERIEKVLIGLGFHHNDLTRLCEEFSGGWQMRIALAKVLLQEPNMLLLDEPTNYLDLEARQFLEGWLRSYPHSILLVSHDRYFLDQVVTRITEIHDGKLSDYHCNYSTYLVEREERLARLISQAERVEEERAKIQSFIDRFRYKADKAALVQSRVKQLEKLEKIELPSVRKKIRFRFPQPERSGKIALEVDGLSAGYDTKPNVLNKVVFNLVRGDKVALVGINGAGKTTLIKVLAGELPSREGEFKLGHNVRYDYFAQEVHKQLDPSLTVYQTLERCCPFALIPHLRDLLGAFLFSGGDVEKKVMVLSGGERNRLALARMLLVPANLLLMDEPTNHLDLDAKEVLLEALQAFEGTVLFVSHDRYFLDHLSTKVLALENGELYVYPGTYPDFLHHIEQRRLRGDFDVVEDKATQAVEQIAAKNKAMEKEERIRRWKEDKQKQREREKLEKSIQKLEEDIAAKERAAKSLVEEMADPKYATSFSELEKLADKKARIDIEIKKLTAEWESSSLRFEELNDEAADAE